ncbi:unnamed protein product [Cuscuta campestris]|uniref:Uncharacterized protein n=1 Tax=Cuscuta campestris TaxID=132261 RepID=A0A484LTK1_9ASTE|nr:unnamed protein product [Cuscuta campestris]
MNFQLLRVFTLNLQEFYRGALEKSRLCSSIEDGCRAVENTSILCSVDASSMSNIRCGDWLPPLVNLVDQEVSASNSFLSWENESIKKPKAVEREFALLCTDPSLDLDEHSCSKCLFAMDTESLTSEFGLHALSSAIPALRADQSLTGLDKEDDTAKESNSLLFKDHWEGAEADMGCEAPLDQQYITSQAALTFIPCSLNPFGILESSEDHEETLEACNLNSGGDNLMDLFNCSSTARMMKLNALEDAGPEFEEPALYTHSEGEKTVFIDSKLEPFRIITPSSSKMSMQLPKLAKGKATYSPSHMVTRSRAKMIAAGRKEHPIKGVDTSDEERESFVEGIRSAFKRSCPSIKTTDIQTCTPTPKCQVKLSKK